MTEVKIKLELDPEADAAYISLSEDAVVVETCSVNDEVNVDLDDQRMVVGIETLRADAPIPFVDLEREFHVRSDVIDLLRTIRPTPGRFIEYHSTSDAGATSSLRAPVEPSTA